MTDKRAIMADLRSIFGNVGMLSKKEICQYFNKSRQSAFISDFTNGMTYHDFGREKGYLVMDVADAIIKMGRN